MSQSYFIVVLDEENNREVYDFANEIDVKTFIIYEMNGWDDSTPKSDIDPELVEFYMKLSIQSLISKAKKYYSIKIEKCLNDKNEVSTHQ